MKVIIAEIKLVRTKLPPRFCDLGKDFNRNNNTTVKKCLIRFNTDVIDFMEAKFTLTEDELFDDNHIRKLRANISKMKRGLRKPKRYWLE